MKQKPALFFHWFFTHPIIAAVNVTMGILLILLGSGIFALNQTKQMISQLKAGDLVAASSSATTSKPIVSFFNGVTLHRLPDLKVWQEVLEIPANTLDIVSETENISSQFASENKADISALNTSVETLANHLKVVEKQIDATYFLQSELSTEELVLIHQSPEYIHAIQTVLSSLSQGDQTWIVLLQNTDELRATGGFPGSYALIHFRDGQLTDVVIEDIYDADGQFQGYIAAPAGIREYTSANKGLRLPDANWWPNFPDSAQTLLQFFALGDKRQVSGIITVNSSLFSSLLKITGPIPLPDYDIELNSENMRQVLRSERGSFFPGSNQKKFVLNQAFTQFQHQVASLNSEQKLKVLATLKNSFVTKDIQIYSPQPDLQAVFSKFKVAGTLQVSNQEASGCDCTPLELMLVESNVGINKVNTYVTREVSVELQPSLMTISTNFTNAAAPMSATELSSLIATNSAVPKPRNGNGYLNYYRLIISPEFSVQKISIAGQEIANWDDELITGEKGQKLRQIGFLVGVPEQQSVANVISLSSTQPVFTSAMKIYKQSGLTPTNYSVTWNGSTDAFSLSEDKFILR